MIMFDQDKIVWCIDNGYFEWRIGLKANQCHHLGLLPTGMWNAALEQAAMENELQPEAEVHIRGENRPKHHGLRWLGCSASQRAEYQSYKIMEHNDGQELILTSLDPLSLLQINNHYRVFDDSPAIRRHVSLENLSQQQIEIEHLGSFSLYGIPVSVDKESDSESTWLHTFPSSWCWEGQMKSMTVEEAGLYGKTCLACWHVENSGSWSCKEYTPFFILENKVDGLFWCVQIEHSGSWRFEVGSNFPADNSLFMQGGLGNFTYAHWSKLLQPDERFESIPVSIAAVQGTLDDALNAMHRHRANILIQRSEPDQELPVIFNEWISTQGNVREETVLSDIEQLKDSGVDIYVLDAGWYMSYGKPDEDGVWHHRAGDWEVSPTRFPNGIAYVAEKISQAGMIPGLWFEIEIFGLESQNYQHRTDLMMTIGDRVVEDNNRRFLYFGSDSAQQFATDVFEKYIAYGFRYFKIDYNCDCGLGCTNSGDSLGQGLVEHIRGYYRWLDHLRDRHPNIIIENCSSGGNRMDYGMLAHSDLASVTDQADWFRLGALFYGSAKVIHPSQAGMWSTLLPDIDDREFIFRLVNSMMGRMHISGQLAQLSLAKQSLLKQAVAFYKDCSPIIKEAKLYWHTPNVSLETPKGWAVLQMNDGQDNNMLVGCWKHDDESPDYSISLKGIDSEAIYEIEQFPYGAKRRAKGAELEEFTFELDEKFSASLIKISIVA